MADQRIQYTEEMVGNGHPTKADTLNRHANVEHNSDGTHKAAAISSGGVYYILSQRQQMTFWLRQVLECILRRRLQRPEQSSV